MSVPGDKFHLLLVRLFENQNLQAIICVAFDVDILTPTDYERKKYGVESHEGV